MLEEENPCARLLGRGFDFEKENGDKDQSRAAICEAEEFRSALSTSSSSKWEKSEL